MTDESAPFRARAQQQRNTVPTVKVRDSRARSIPTAPVRERASGKYRQKQGGRRGQ
jgi:hypothetical protein